MVDLYIYRLRSCPATLVTLYRHTHADNSLGATCKSSIIILQRVFHHTVAQISVQPANASGEDADGEDGKAEIGGNSSLESSMRTNHSGARLSGQHTSSDSKSATPRAGSQLSRQNYSGHMREAGGRGYQRITSGSRRFVGAGGLQSNRNTTSAKRFSWQGERRLTSAGLPLQRDLDLSSSGLVQRKKPVPIPLNSPDSEYGTVVLLGLETTPNVEQAATCCQLCGHDFNTLRIPFLLLCGHSYCGPCIDMATDNYPSALKCGVCSITTPLGQQNADTLPRNESILDLVTSREFTAMVNEKNVEKCAECIHHPASVYCSECTASYCDNCAKKAHEGSRVRSKHKPVPVNLKPRPQPTCRKHPGQSCVLYCETEKQPMCVLCKFYNQHRFHKYVHECVCASVGELCVCTSCVLISGSTSSAKWLQSTQAQLQKSSPSWSVWSRI